MSNKEVKPMKKESKTKAVKAEVLKTYIVEHTEESDANHEFIRIGVNGRRYNIPMGIPIQLPQTIVELLKRKKYTYLKQDPKTNQNINVEKRMYSVSEA